MDIQHFTHQSYRVSVWVAVVLSGLIVTLAALVGRGTLNLKGALALAEPTDVTVIAAVEPTLGTGTTITNVEFLRKEPIHEIEKHPRYDYQVTTSDGDHALVVLGFNSDAHIWTVVSMDHLHVDPVTDASAPATESAPRP